MPSSSYRTRWAQLIVSWLLVTTTSLLLFSAVTVAATKPVKNLKVAFRGTTFTIPHDVSTVEELTERFQEASGINLADGNGDDSSAGQSPPNRLLWKGRMLKPNETLSEAGIQNGDKVLILPGGRHGKGLDVLAMYLFLLSDNEDEVESAVTKIQQEQSEALETLQEFLDSMGDNLQNQASKFNRKDVADSLRNAFDLTYLRLRSWWEHPSLRRSMHDPERIESYRTVISTNLSKKVLAKTPPRVQKAVQSPEIWRKEFVKATSVILRLGDTVLDGILDLLLDVLKGKTSESFSARYATAAAAAAAAADSSTATTTTNTDPRMEDPSLANDLLYELSESEDDMGEDDGWS